MTEGSPEADGFPWGTMGNLQCPQVMVSFGCHLTFILHTKCGEQSNGCVSQRILYACR